MGVSPAGLGVTSTSAGSPVAAVSAVLAVVGVVVVLVAIADVGTLGLALTARRRGANGRACSASTRRAAEGGFGSTAFVSAATVIDPLDRWCPGSGVMANRIARITSVLSRPSPSNWAGRNARIGISIGHHGSGEPICTAWGESAPRSDTSKGTGSGASTTGEENLLAPAPASASGCGDATDETDVGVSRRDSTGISIVVVKSVSGGSADTRTSLPDRPTPVGDRGITTQSGTTGWESNGSDCCCSGSCGSGQATPLGLVVSGQRCPTSCLLVVTAQRVCLTNNTAERSCGTEHRRMERDHFFERGNDDFTRVPALCSTARRRSLLWRRSR